jgi:hypothetical protein
MRVLSYSHIVGVSTFSQKRQPLSETVPSEGKNLRNLYRNLIILLTELIILTPYWKVLVSVIKSFYVPDK